MTVAVLVVMGTGSTVVFAAGHGQSVQQSSHAGNDAGTATVTAEEISADQIRLEGVEVSNLTIDLSEIQTAGTVLQDSLSSAVGSNIEGLMVDSIEIGTIQNVSVSVEDNVTTIDAEIESITLVGVSADRVTTDGPTTGDSMTQSMFGDGALSFDSVTVEGLTVGTVTSETAAAETPAEPETPTPTEPETPTEETPTPTPTPTPMETETPTEETPTPTPMETETPVPTETPTEETPTPMETETPTEETPAPTPTPMETETPTEETPAPTPTPMETETPTEETPAPTPTPMETETPTEETPTPTQPTDGEGDGIGDDGSNVTDGADDNVTVTEEASVTFEDQTSDGMVVNLANISLPNSGYIAIHNDSLLEGDAVGSVIGVSEFYGAGTYENESVSLFDVPGVNFTETQLNGSQTLIAMPHQETNGNTTYDFVATNGTADGPYTSNGTAVTDAANITVNETVLDGDQDSNVTDTEDDNVTVGEEDDNVTVDEGDNITVGEEDDNVTVGEEDDNITVEEEAAVTFEDQTSDGTSVNLANFTLPDGGYIAIHNDSLLEGDAVGSVVGVSAFLEQGTSEDVNITLFDVPGANFSQTQLTESQTLIAMPHQETGDNITYDFVTTNGTADGPYLSNGSAVTDAANITVNQTAVDGDDNVTVGEEDGNVTDAEGDNVTTGEEAAVSFESQATNGTAVAIANFTLPDGGYVAIHNESLLEGDAVGSVIGVSEFFEPGTYENESVTLFEVPGANFSQAQLSGLQTLIAMPHQETDGNTTYDFVATNGTADGPYLSNGSAVTDNATVAVESE